MYKNIPIFEVINNLILMLELHEENAYRINNYKNLALFVKKTALPLLSLSLEEVIDKCQLSQNMARKIVEISSTGTLEELTKYLEITPKGIFNMLKINGIGPKKARVFWKELGIEDLKSLKVACKNDEIIKLKGFGKKAQEKILEEVDFYISNKSKSLYAHAEQYISAIKKDILNNFDDIDISETGQLRRKVEVIEKIELVIGVEDKKVKRLLDWLNIHDRLFETDLKYFESLNLSEIEKIIDIKDIKFIYSQHCQKFLKNDIKLYLWKGKFINDNIKVNIYLTSKQDFSSILFLTTGSASHLKSFFDLANNKDINSKTDKEKSEIYFYSKLGLQYILPELREGRNEIELAKLHKLPNLIEESDIKGVLHCHSKYSDGMNSIHEIAKFCIDHGYSYLGISDHSKSAFYAGGMRENQILFQHMEIDKLNLTMAPFKIFKGIECDILNDGNLDYEDNILKSFDFVIASIHSNLKMTKSLAMKRLIKAIRNPYTKILGHMTGRLLLRRNGYPIDHKVIIDECVSNNVIIEINANPNRLDMDWRWIEYALYKNAILSINPDAHTLEGCKDIKYGVFMARKGLATKDNILNTFSVEEVQKLFRKK